MYALIASGGNPFAIDETGQNALDYAIKSDPIKSCILLIDLDKTCNCPTKKQIINNYLLTVQNIKVLDPQYFC